MHSKGDNIEFMINYEADEVAEKLFQSLLSRYQIRVETSMKDSEFVFDFVDILYYKCHKTNPDQVGSYINTPEWIKKNKSNNKSHQ